MGAFSVAFCAIKFLKWHCQRLSRPVAEGQEKKWPHSLHAHRLPPPKPRRWSRFSWPVPSPPPRLPDQIPQGQEGQVEGAATTCYHPPPPFGRETPGAEGGQLSQSSAGAQCPPPPPGGHIESALLGW